MAAVTRNARLIALFNLPLAAVACWLLWNSLDWPLVGDATIFHFIANQILLGELPYRDIFDINMPLVYGIHVLLVLAGGMSDVAWRIFDLSAVAAMSGCILALVRPVGWPPAILAALVFLAFHLLLGPYAAGQRDFLIAILAVAVAWLAATAAESTTHRHATLFAAGLCAMAAASIKPTGILLMAVPAVTLAPVKTRDVLWIIAGALSIAVPLFATLALFGALPAFVTMVVDLLPRYSAISNESLLGTLAPLALLLPLAALALAAVTAMMRAPSPRLRAMMAITVFGIIHLVAQRKGFFYHVYPLAAGLACLGSWQLARFRASWVSVFLAVTLLLTLASVWRSDDAPEFPELRAADDMQTALEAYLPHGARVQMLDSDRGAFLAMARADMKQATPHIQWFSLITADRLERQRFLSALTSCPPDAVLLTNDYWPADEGFAGIERWHQFTQILTQRYDLKAIGTEDYIKWRLYLRRNSSPSGLKRAPCDVGA